jgi:hypothetical protein
LSVLYHYWRYLCEYDETIYSLQTALNRAKDDVEYGTAHPDAITLEDGTVLEHEEIMQRSGYYDDVDGYVVDGSIAPRIEDVSHILEQNSTTNAP